jgi:hypothetical protein
MIVMSILYICSSVHTDVSIFFRPARLLHPWCLLLCNYAAATIVACCQVPTPVAYCMSFCSVLVHLELELNVM